MRLCLGSNHPDLRDHVGMALNPATIQFIALSMQSAYAITDTIQVYNI